VAQLQRGEVGVGLVGEEHLEAVPVGVGEGKLGAGMGILTAANRPGALGPAGKVQSVQFGDLGAQAGLSVGVHGGHPSGVGDGQDGLAHALVGRQADREPDAALAQVIGEGWVAPPVSARTSSGWSRAGLGSCARARSRTSM
jgi:hypothetical protein